MTLIICKKCGERISSNVSKCPYCGETIAYTVTKRKNTIKCSNCGKRYNSSHDSCPYCNPEMIIDLRPKEEKIYYKHLDLLRIIFCIAVLLYHMFFFCIK